MNGAERGGQAAGRPGALVSTDWLATRLHDPSLVVLDASWYLPGSGRSALDEYRERHVPGAIFFDLDRASDPDSPWPHMFPGADAFAAYAGGLGIGSGVRVVAYDGSGTNLSAARAWWMLRHIGHTEVAVLDGGLGKWRAESRPLSSGIETREPARLVPAPGAGRIVTREEVRDALARGAAQVVDVRVAERFLGAVPEPRPGIPSGHMAGAVNFPHPELVSRDGTVIVAADLEARLAARGIDPTRPVVAVCGSGTSACALLLALDSLGTAGHCLYDGSWTEWAGSGMPVASGV